MRTASILPAVLIFLVVFTESDLWAQGHLFIVPSPQALGRGGIYTSAWSDDPLVSMINPGMLGFLAERNRVAVGFYPRRMTWGFPYSPPESFSYYARAVNVGFSSRTLRKFFDWKSPVSFGISYHELRLNLPEALWVDSEGHRLGSYDGFEDARGVSIGAGLHGKSVQLGVGWSGRYVRMDLGPPQYETDMFSHDVGFVVQSSVKDMFLPSARKSESASLHHFVRPSFAYTVSNIGPSYRFGDNTRRDPQPRSDALTLALAMGIDATLHGGGTLQLLSLEAGEQVGDHLVDFGKPEGHWYRVPLTDIQPINDLVLGKYHRDISHRKGFEVALCETMYLRWGSVEDEHNPWLSQRYSATGWGVRALGLLKLLAADSRVRSGSVTGVIIRHLDLQYDYTTRDDSGEGSWMDGVTYQQLVLLWRY